MPSRAISQAAVLIGLAGVFWLGYMSGRVQNIGDVSRLYRDADTGRVSLTRAGVLVHFERLGGAGKPYLRTADGLELLDISDWDRESHVAVDGSDYELVRLYPQAAVDYERFRVAETLNGDGWLLQREITLEADGTVRIEHSFIARRPVQRVDLALTHAHAYFSQLQADEHAIIATLPGLTRDQIETGTRGQDAYRIFVESATDQPAIGFRSGNISPWGPRSFVADMSVDRPPQDIRVPIGTELIRVEAVRS